MSLEKQINDRLKEAMKAKDAALLRTLRSIKSEILKEKTKAGATEMTEDIELKMLSKMAKQRRDSLEVFKSEGREELAQKEAEELAIIETFLPEQMSEAEILEKVKAIKEKIGANAPSDMGKLMGASMKELAGKADGKVISAIAKQLLNN